MKRNKMTNKRNKMANKKDKQSDEIDVAKELASKYNQIEQLVAEYNNLARKNKIDSLVGCIITPNQENNDEDEDYYDDESNYSYSGWVPSSLGC